MGSSLLLQPIECHPLTYAPESSLVLPMPLDAPEACAFYTRSFFVAWTRFVSSSDVDPLRFSQSVDFAPWSQVWKSCHHDLLAGGDSSGDSWSYDQLSQRPSIV